MVGLHGQRYHTIKPFGLLNPLSIPSRPWDAIGVDFVGPLPESKDRDGEYDSSRINYTAREVAELMFTEVYKHHGLNGLIGIKQKMSSAYHPETDGATERANRTIGQMLRCCIGPNQKDWVSKLPFFLNTGRMPRKMIWDAPTKEEYPSVKAFANRMKLTVMEAHDAIMKARVKQTIGANRKRRDCPFVKGDLV